MLAESVTSILIPRMSELQTQNDTREIIRITARAMQKLAFFYFPIYIFLMITAQTFITTLFTHNYLQSVPIFLINISILPLYILISDPIVRAYKELGRFLLTLRIFIIVALVAALYFGIQHFDLRGMIAIVVVASAFDRLVSTWIVLKKLKVERGDLFLLKDIGKTAVASLIAGFFTYLFYREFNERIFHWGETFTRAVFSSPNESIVDFISGSLVLSVCASVFTPIYLLGANRFGIIEDGEKNKIESIYRKATGRREPETPRVIQNPNSEIQN